MPVFLEPRPLAPKERAVIERILQAGFSGSVELGHQLDRVRVVALWGTGSVSIDLRVADGVPRAPAPTGVAPATCAVTGDDGEVVGEILLWVESGRLSGLEYAWYGDEPPITLPEVDRLVVRRT